MTTVASENEIRREMVLKASPAKVWSALTTPEGWTGWFSNAVEGKFEVGETLTLNFGDSIECFAIVSEKEEMKAFAYQWHPGEDCAVDRYDRSEMTTVRFTLEPIGEGTKLVMTETGFAALPDSRRGSAFQANTGGWDWELKELVAFVDEDERQPKPKFDIYRERVYPVSIQTLWNAVATPEGFKGWFVTKIEGDLSVGSLTTFYFGENLSGPLKVIEKDEPNLFVFRWHPGEENGCTWDKYPEEETTTVSFALKEVEGGTMLVVKESGFDSIPESRRLHSLGLNKQGWTECMDLIGKYLAKGQ